MPLIKPRIRYLATYKSVAEIPRLDISFPRPVVSLHQLELTNRCNLKCVYCPSRSLKRQRLDMDKKTFTRCLEVAAYFVGRGTQVELNLAGTGESTLHPDFVEYVNLAREAVGPDTVITMATNGVALTEAMVEGIRGARPFVWVSMHSAAKAARAAYLLGRAGIFAGASLDPATNANSWAGQVDWQESWLEHSTCMWQRQGFAMALPDGRLIPCCMDVEGKAIIGHVDDPAPAMRTQPYSLCRSCHQEIGCRGYDQRGDRGV